MLFIDYIVKRKYQIRQSANFYTFDLFLYSVETDSP